MSDALRTLDAATGLSETPSVLIAQLSDVHVGGGGYRRELLRIAIEEINAATPDLVVVAGDVTDEGYSDQYPLAREELAALACRRSSSPATTTPATSVVAPGASGVKVA